MKTRIIHTKIWNDDFFSGLKWNEKLLFIYLITNDRIGLTGAYECPDRLICFDTGLTKEQLEESKPLLGEKFVFSDSWIVIKNANKYNNYCSNEKQKMAFMKEYYLLPEKVKKYIDPVDAPDYSRPYQKVVGGYKHRVIAEALLERKLDPLEVVHHIDKNPSNNDPLNLMVMSEEDHKLFHSQKKNLEDISRILVSDLYDTNHKSKIINNKEEIINKKSKIEGGVGGDCGLTDEQREKNLNALREQKKKLFGVI